MNDKRFFQMVEGYINEKLYSGNSEIEVIQEIDRTAYVEFTYKLFFDETHFTLFTFGLNLLEMRLIKAKLNRKRFNPFSLNKK